MPFDVNSWRKLRKDRGVSVNLTPNKITLNEEGEVVELTFVNTYFPYLLEPGYDLLIDGESLTQKSVRDVLDGTLEPYSMKYTLYIELLGNYNISRLFFSTSESVNSIVFKYRMPMIYSNFYTIMFPNKTRYISFPTVLEMPPPVPFKTYLPSSSTDAYSNYIEAYFITQNPVDNICDVIIINSADDTILKGITISPDGIYVDTVKDTDFNFADGEIHVIKVIASDSNFQSKIDIYVDNSLIYSYNITETDYYIGIVNGIAPNVLYCDYLMLPTGGL